MNFKRATGGFLLSFVFLIFFAYIIFDIQWVFENFFQKYNKDIFLGSISDNIKETITINDDNIHEQNNQQMQGLNVSAQAVISVESNLSGPDKILFSQNEQRKLSIASISKLMTALIAVENLDLSQEIKISDKAANQSYDPEPLKAGEIFYARDILYAMLIGSDNTASYALSESIGVEKFVSLMNARATELGLSDTEFGNPTGLGLDNFSTTQDLAKLAEFLLKERPSILGTTIIPEFDLRTVDGKTLHKIINTDELLGDSSDLTKRIIGGKTGNTRTAGQSLLLIVRPLNNQGYLINVILNSNDRFGEMKKIIDWIDVNY